MSCRSSYDRPLSARHRREFFSRRPDTEDEEPGSSARNMTDYDSRPRGGRAGGGGGYNSRKRRYRGMRLFPQFSPRSPFPLPLFPPPINRTISKSPMITLRIQMRTTFPPVPNAAATPTPPAPNSANSSSASPNRRSSASRTRSSASHAWPTSSARRTPGSARSLWGWWDSWCWSSRSRSRLWAPWCLY